MADPKQPGDSTRSVHGGEREHRESAALTTPIHQTSTFWFRDSEEVRAYAEGRLVRDEYGRYGNPTWRAAERKLSELEGAEATLGAAVVVAPGVSDAALARVRWRTVRGTERTAPLARNAGLVAGNAMAACLPFFEAIAIQEARTVRVGLSPYLLLELEFDFPVHEGGPWS